VQTDQEIGGFVSIPDPRNRQLPDEQSRDRRRRYPEHPQFRLHREPLRELAAAANFAWSIFDNAAAQGRRIADDDPPNPNAMLPGVNFSSPSADIGSPRQPRPEPFVSENIDLGFEYYLGGESYVAVAAFQKRVDGFTVNGNETLPFNDLAVYGITFDTLTPTQQAAINARGVLPTPPSS
jgi:hypothetical protein